MNLSKRIGIGLISGAMMIVGLSGTASGGAPVEVGTAITYQGRLTRLGSLVGVPANFRFRLYDAAMGGDQVGPELSTSTVPVGGLFTVSLDFGVNPYTSNDALWLEIDVAAPAGGSFETLAPRQRLTSAPFALNTRGIEVDANDNLNLFGNAVFSDVNTFIGGRQANGSSGSLTIAAPGNVSSQGQAVGGGELILRAGNANTSAGAAPPVGTSFGNDVIVQAGDNVALFAFGQFFNGNIRFIAGDAVLNGGVQPERMRIVGDNGFVGIGTITPDSLLHLNGTGDSGITVEATGAAFINFSDNVGSRWGMGNDPIDNFYIDEAGVGRALTIAPGAFVGLGRVQDPAETIDMNGNILLRTSATIGGPQVNGQPTNLTIQAGGNVSSQGQAVVGGQLTLRAGNANTSASSAPPLGTSFNNDVVIQAGDNVAEFSFANRFPGNIRFIAGDGGFGGGNQPERMRLVGDNGQLLIGTAVASNGFLLDVAGNIRCVSLTQTSAREFKQNITDLTGALESIMKLNAVQYDWNELAPEQVQGKHDIGFLADEVNEVLPDIVAKDDSGKPIGIDYTKITPVAVEAIKQLKGENDDLKARLAALESLVSKLADQAAE